MAVQNIRIRYEVDDSDLVKVDKNLSDISEEEKRVATNATKMSDAIKKGSKEAQKSTSDLNSDIKEIGLAIAAAFSIDAVIGFANKIITVRGEFQKLEAVLTNTLGSQSAAQRALSDINTFASKTNFGVIELTNSFVKLANQGFTPTLDEMGNLADLANSTGKSFDMLTEAIIDAQTGEFERLKEFGIRASKEGDNVKFTFKGVETQTKFTSTAIRDYIVALGDLNGVQGSTEAISRTLVGQVSNLGDSFDQLFNTIGQGSEGILVDFISLLNDSISTANKLLQTQEQLGKQQRQNSENLLTDQAKVRLSNRLEIDFLTQRKNTDAAYTKSFVENRTAEQTAEFEAYKQTSTNRKAAAAEVIADLQSVLDNYKQATSGMSISATIAFKASLKDQLDAAIRYYGELEAAEKKAQEAKNKPLTQKGLDDEYKKQLALLKEREQNTIREAKVEEMSKVFLLDIEKQYNEDRVALFKRYNQQNIEELRGYNIRFREIQKESNDAIVENNIKYAKLEGQKVDITQGTGELIKNINLSTAEENVKNFYKERDEFIKAQEDKKRAAEKLRDALVNAFGTLYNALAQRQQAITQNQIAENEKMRDQDLASAQSQTDQKKELKLQEINQIKDEEERTKKLREYEVRANQNAKDAQYNVNQRYDELNRQLKRKQAESDRQQAEFNIIINAAQAVSKTLATGGPLGIALSAIVGGLALAQIGIIESTPLPVFKKGGFTGNGFGRDETGDRVAGVVHEREFVFNKEKTMEFRPLFEAIHRGEVDPKDLAQKEHSQQVFDYVQMKSAMKEALKSQPRNDISFDERGFIRKLIQDGKREEFVNKKYSSK